MCSITSSAFTAFLQPNPEALNAGLSEPHGLRAASTCSLAVCPRNRQQAKLRSLAENPLTLPELIDLAERLSEMPPQNARDVRELLQSVEDSAALNSNDLFCQIARGMLRIDEDRFGLDTPCDLRGHLA